MTIFFDLDGTLNRFYDVPNWLEKIRNNDVSPYEEAQVMLNMSLLARYLHKAQNLGIKIGIISWTSKGGSSSYNSAVEAAKRSWLAQHLPSVEWDEIHIVEYNIPKQNYATKNDILFDDNEGIRNDWTGTAYTPDDILNILKSLTAQG